MQDSVRPFLDFYGAEEIIPTSQVIADEVDYRKHRAYLFRRLGIPLSWLEGKSVFELGPGNGQKAEVLMNYGPSEYVAVDGNPRSVSETASRLLHYGERMSVEIIEADFTNFSDPRRYDLVIAEAVIPTQIDTGVYLRKLRRLLRPGGVLVFTCMDSGSLLSEMLRRAIANELRDPNLSMKTQAEELSRFFQADLEALEGMTRLAEDWVIDQLIHPWIGPLLDIPTALSSLEDHVDFLGSSPSFLQDWRWYKAHEVLAVSLGMVSEAYWSSAHNLLDKRVQLPARDPKLNRDLFRATLALYDAVMGQSYGSLEALVELTDDVRASLPDGAQATVDSISAFEAFAKDGDASKLGPMQSWWGRGQQYVSVVAHEI